MPSIRDIYMKYYRDATGKFNYGKKPIPVWDGGTDRFGRTYKCVWDKLENFFSAHDYNVEYYIHAQFLAKQGKRPPTPNQLISDVAIKNYKSYSKEIGTRLKRQFAMEKSIVNSEFNALSTFLRWDSDRCMRRILKDKSLELSNFYRYCKAKKLGLEDIADLYFVLAKSEYKLCKKFYRAAYNEILANTLDDVDDS